MDIVGIENDDVFHLSNDEHDYIHIVYIGVTFIFFLIEVFQRISIDFIYGINTNIEKIHILALNRYPTDFTTTSFTISIAWYFVFLWQAAWMIYSLIGIFRRTPSGTYFYRSPCVMNKWCFFYTAFALILYTPQLAAATRNKYTIGISIFRYVGTLCEVVVILTIIHLCLWENMRDYRRQRLFIDVWLTRLLYHNGIALWASVLFYESCLSIVIGLIHGDFTSSTVACLIGCSIFISGLLIYSILENLIFYNSLSFTFSPWIVFVWILSGICFRELNDNLSSPIVLWFLRTIFCLTLFFTILRSILFLWRYKQKSIPTFHSTRIYSLIIEPRQF